MAGDSLLVGFAAGSSRVCDRIYDSPRWGDVFTILLETSAMKGEAVVCSERFTRTEAAFNSAVATFHHISHRHRPGRLPTINPMNPTRTLNCMYRSSRSAKPTKCYEEMPCPLDRLLRWKPI